MRELAKAKQEMAALRLQHQRLSSKLQDYSIFNKYLEKVVENSEVRGEAGAFLSPTSPSLTVGTFCRNGHPTTRAAGKGPWSGLGRLCFLVRVGDGVVCAGDSCVKVSVWALCCESGK